MIIPSRGSGLLPSREGIIFVLIAGPASDNVSPAYLTEIAGLVLGPPPLLEAAASGDSLDWKEISADEITQRVTSKVQSGSIVLFHNAALHTPEALPGIIEALLQEGYTFIPISEMILTGDYTIDNEGRQCPG